ncbi:MAG: hypothetical protein JWP91_2342 [Fibrobacteres bacterium]|nr:hypothetical protein [Fibrobacterota bacterium]
MLEKKIGNAPQDAWRLGSYFPIAEIGQPVHAGLQIIEGQFAQTEEIVSVFLEKVSEDPDEFFGLNSLVKRAKTEQEGRSPIRLRGIGEQRIFSALEPIEDGRLGLPETGKVDPDFFDLFPVALHPGQGASPWPMRTILVPAARKP